jgi:hypothetical protein
LSPLLPATVGIALLLVAAPPPLVLDDFSRSDGRPLVGAGWRAFTDQVMGGLSTQAVTREVVAGERALRLRGDVRLENDGGFVQVALDLGGAADASAYTGLRLRVLGNGERYSLHLRSRDTRLPWQYYEASFPAGPQWSEVELPFDRFVPQALRAPLDAGSLTRIGLVASKRAFRADVAVSRIELY